MAEIWNSFAGVAPFSELKPVKKFTDRKAGAGRIWQAVQRLATEQPVATAEPTSEPKAKKAPTKAAKAPKKTEERSNKKAEVVELMKRAHGVTLAEVMEATGWQAHTVRGFVSLLGSKAGETIESTKNAKGERSYKIAK